MTSLLASVSLWFVLPFAQSSAAASGTWYGAINPPGLRFEVAVTLQNIAGWTGSLLMENGNSFPLRDIAINTNTIAFSIDLRGERVRFNGTMKGEEITGNFTQQNQNFPFELSRKPTPALTSAAIGIDPKELIEAITEFTGPLS